MKTMYADDTSGYLPRKKVDVVVLGMPPPSHIKAGYHVDPSPSPAAPRAILSPLEGRDGFAFALTVAQVKRASPDASLACRIVEEHVSRIPSSFSSDDHPQHRFETFLAGLNAAIAQVVRTTEWTLPIKSFRSVVGIACDGEMYLSGTGDLTALFLHQTVDRRYQVFNLARSIQTGQALPTWEKPFAVVLDGAMESGDVFCLCNRDLSPMIDNDELCAILSALPPAGAAAKIRQYFPFNDVLSLVILRCQADEPALEAARPRAEVSLEALARSRERTDQLIEDQAPRPRQLISRILRRLRQEGDEEGAVHRRARRGALGALLDRLSRASHALLAWRTRRDAGSSDARARIVRTPPMPLSETLASLIRRLTDVPRRSRALLLGSLAVLLVLGASLAVLSRAREARLASERLDERLRKADDLREQASAAAIYHDDGRAIALFEQARQAVDAFQADLPAGRQGTPERAQEADRIREDVQAGLNRLYRVVALSDVPLVVALSDATAMGMSGDALYVFGRDRRVFAVDPALKRAEALALGPSGAGTAVEVASDEGRWLYLDDRPGVSVLDPTGPAAQVTSLSAEPGWKDVASYGGRLYVLSLGADDAQVLRMNDTSAGFGAPSGWIRSKSSSLATARSIAVDGSVFVLTADRLVRFMNGGETGWEARAVEPPMADATDVWTDSESDRACALEPSASRVLCFAKSDGALLAQYRADAFATATDLLVDEASGTVYVLAKDGLYAFKSAR